MHKARGRLGVSRAGRKGGTASSVSHGREFYEQLGYKAGPQEGARMRNSIEERRKFRGSH